MAARKAPAKKAPAKTKKNIKEDPKCSGKGSGRGGARQTEIDKMLEESLEAVEQHFLAMHDEEKPDTFGCSVLQIQFARELINNGFKIAPAYKKAVGKSVEHMTNQQLSTRGRNWLDLAEVQLLIARELYNRRVAADVTHDWVTKKYRLWSEIDPTEFFEIVEVKSRGGNSKQKRYTIQLKIELENLPRHVRTAIKSMSVDPKTGSVKVELVDQKGALDQLCKLLGFTNDKLLNLESEEIHLHFDAQDAEA